EVIDLFASFFKRTLPTDQIIDMTGLREKMNTRSKDLSGGQRQRLSVALALINDPDLVFLDEPTTGLDPQARRRTWDVIEQLRSQGKTILMTTHYLDEAERLCDRVAVVDHGKIIAMDKPKELIRQHFHEQAIEFRSRNQPPETRLRGLAGVTAVQTHDGVYTCYSRDVPASMGALLDLAGEHVIEFDDLTVRRATLEDVFLKLTGRRIRE
ncbi:MAG: ABC transporter ATP-binding protein, partial [Chloroflexi bacterium]|nr:ABC transporter ATP-binding protein [Chloroflexota bacterium]